MCEMEIRRPIGLDMICKEVDECCRKAKVYRYIGKKPGPYMLYMNEGDGRSTVREFFEDMFSAYQVIDFDSGLDKSIELKFVTDLTPFEIERCAAIYTDNYEGIEVHELTEEFAQTFYMSQYETYLTKIKEAAKYAVLIFFVPREPSKTMRELILRIEKEMEGLCSVRTEEYSAEELCQIVVRRLKNDGIQVNNTNAFATKLLTYMERSGCVSLKSAMKLAEQLEFGADFSSEIPVLDLKRLDDLQKKYREKGNKGI